MPRYSKDKDIAKECVRLLDAGWTFEDKGRSPHAKLRSPGGRQLAVPGSPHGGSRATANWLASVRRIEREEKP
jgi:hypothetical protein